MPLLRPFTLILTSFYLIGPLLILGELLRPEISVPIIGLFLLWATPFACARFTSAPVLHRPFAATLVISSVAAAALCLAWIYLSGTGGYAHMHWDYMKHNLIFSALLDRFLPVVADNNGSPFILHYSFAYYIAPVRLHQLLDALGLRVELDPLLVATYTSALFLSVFLLARARVSILLLTVMLIISGGWDLIGWWAFDAPTSWIGTTIPYVDIGVPANLDWWGLPYAPQSLGMNLFWAPQHFFGALLGTALLYVIVETDRPMALRLIDVVILVVASAYWSSYVAVGLIVLAFIKLAVHHDVPTALRPEGSAPILTFRFVAACLFAGAFALVTAIFYEAAEPLSAPGILLRDKSVLLWLLTYILNYSPPLILLALIFWPRAWRTDAGAPRHLFPMLAACLAASAVLLLIVHGRYDDWGMRTTLPLSIALTLLLTQGISAGLKGAYLVIMVGVIVVSSASGLAQVTQGALLPPNRAPYGSFTIGHMGDLAFQYQGRADSILYRYLIRR